MRNKIHTLIVDDEPIARKGIRRELERDSEIKILGECANGRDAVTVISQSAPDLVFLDLQMPELDGFGVVEAVGVEQMAAVIFVTAYDEFALRAFEIHALDYLLKPFTSERFQKALQRAKAQISQNNLGALHQQLLSVIQDSHRERREPPYLERVVVKSAGRIFFLNTEDIDWIEAADNYVCLHTGKDAHLIQGTLSGLEGRLDPNIFVRVHRSTIVNIKRIKELQPLFHGEYAIILLNGKKLTSSRGYRGNMQRLLQNPF